MRRAFIAIPTFVRNAKISAAISSLTAGVKPAALVPPPSAGAAEALFTLATAMTADQSMDVGLIYTRLALTLNGDRPEILTLLGDIYENMKQEQKAIDAYSEIPAASPLRTNAEMEIAVNLQRLERKDEALKLREEVQKGFLVSFAYTGDAESEISRFFKQTGKVIVPFTVQEILDEQIAHKLA